MKIEKKLDALTLKILVRRMTERDERIRQISAEAVEEIVFALRPLGLHPDFLSSLDINVAGSLASWDDGQEDPATAKHAAKEAEEARRSEKAVAETAKALAEKQPKEITKLAVAGKRNGS